MHVFSRARRDSFSLRLVTVETRQLHVTPVMNDVPVLTCTKRGRVYMCMYMCALLMMRTISRIKNTCILLHSVHVSRQKRPEEHARIFLLLRRALVRLPTRNTYYVRIPLNVKTVAIEKNLPAKLPCLAPLLCLMIFFYTAVAVAALPPCYRTAWAP
jgi:hypothetical protein